MQTTTCDRCGIVVKPDDGSARLVAERDGMRIDAYSFDLCQSCIIAVDEFLRKKVKHGK